MRVEALVTDFRYPRRVHRAGAGAGFAARFLLIMGGGSQPPAA